jgi:hypothetical protein
MKLSLATYQDLFGELSIVNTVTWVTDNITMKKRNTCTLSSIKALLEVNLSANEPQTLRDEYTWATKILDSDYQPARLDDVIKTCENLHVEAQHQLQIFSQKYEHLFDGTLAEFNMEYQANQSPTDGS